MTKSIDNIVIIGGDSSLDTVESFYTFKEEKQAGGDVILFKKEKSFVSYGNVEPEDDTLLPDFVNQIADVQSTIREIVINNIEIPEDGIFELKYIRVENAEESISKIEAYYNFKYDDMNIEGSINLIDILDTELLLSVQNLYDTGKQLIITREGI